MRKRYDSSQEFPNSSFISYHINLIGSKLAVCVYHHFVETAHFAAN
jgi:hypothetical protein